MSNTYIGIDYGRGLSNIDHTTGIRYGVINANLVGERLWDAQVFDYPEPENPDEEKDDPDDYAEPIGWHYEDDEYKIVDCLDTDAMILKSPFYTRAQYCSPCVPGAGNLQSPMEDGAQTYCLDRSWFEDGAAPYDVYSVATGELLYRAGEKEV